MDKQTFSEYGWIIIIILTLCIIIAAASPFGQRMITSVKGWILGFDKGGKDAIKDLMPLKAVQNINVTVSSNADVLVFDEVPEATKYTVVIDGGEPFEVTSNSVDITDKLNGLVGSVEIIVTPHNENKTGPGKKYIHLIPGLYKSGSDYKVLKKHWRELLSENIVYHEDGVVYTKLDMEGLSLYLTVPDLNLSSASLDGDLLLPHDGTVTQLGNLDVVTFSGNPAFSYCFYLTGIKIPDSVTTISGFAFMYCDLLEKITIPSSVTSMGEGVLANTGIKIADYQASILPYGTFSGCHQLQSVTLSDNITEIGEEAFSLCKSLRNINLPKNLETIRRAAFLDCEALQSIHIPKTVTLIEANPLAQCSGLTSITVEGGNTTYACVNNCLIDVAAQTIIAGCGTSVIPDSQAVTKIGDGAFVHLSMLTSITIPQNITHIGDSAFVACENMTSVVIENSNVEIGTAAFASCSALTRINFNGTTEQWEVVPKSNNWNHNTGAYTIYCTNGNVNK